MPAVAEIEVREAASLHGNALPLYTSFGLDAWWPLLYLHGRLDAVAAPDGWRPEAATADAVLAVLASDDGRACVCLPGPHPGVRPLLAAGWRVAEFDLFMATEPDLIDPLRAVPSPALS